MPDSDDPRIQRAAEVLMRDYESQYSASHLTWRDFADLAEQVLNAAGEPVTEHGQLYSSGGYLTRNPHPEIERIYPLAQWIPHQQRFGGKVWQRRIVVLEDWAEVPRSAVTPEPGPLVPVPLVCGHAATVPEDEVRTKFFWCGTCRSLLDKAEAQDA
jgi:hypothetical protein